MFGNHSAKLTKVLMSTICAAAIVGCSSGGGSGGGDSGTDRTTTVGAESTLNQENLHQVSQSALQAADTAVAIDVGVATTTDVFGTGGQFSSSNIGNASEIYDTQTMMRSVAATTRDAEFLTSIPADFLSLLCTSGSISPLATTDQNTLGLSFSDCMIEAATLDGEVYVSVFDDGDSLSITYNDFTVVSLDRSYDLGSMSLTCSGITSGDFGCDANIVEMLGLDGHDYLLSDISLLGDALSGYDIEALLDDPVHGTFTVTTEDLTFNCDDGHPDSGSLTVNAEDGSSASISFPSCTEYTVCFEGMCETQTWSF